MMWFCHGSKFRFLKIPAWLAQNDIFQIYWHIGLATASDQNCYTNNYIIIGYFKGVWQLATLQAI